MHLFTLTDMKRVTISFDEKSEQAVQYVQANAEKKISYNEAVRRLVLAGFETLCGKKEIPAE